MPASAPANPAPNAPPPYCGSHDDPLAAQVPAKPGATLQTLVPLASTAETAPVAAYTGAGEALVPQELAAFLFRKPAPLVLRL